MKKEKLIESLNIIEDILIETANKPEYKYIHGIAKAVYYILYYEVRNGHLSR